MLAPGVLDLSGDAAAQTIAKNDPNKEPEVSQARADELQALFGTLSRKELLQRLSQAAVTQEVESKGQEPDNTAKARIQGQPEQ